MCGNEQNSYFSKVSPDFTFGPNVQPAKLPKQGEEPAVGAPATIIGWGLTSVNIPMSLTNKYTEHLSKLLITAKKN